MKNKPVLGIFLGEAAGIGPELVAKVIADGTAYQYCKPIIIGDARVLALGQKIAGVSFPWETITDPSQANWDNGAVPLIDLKNYDPTDLVMGTIDTVSGHATGESLITCMELLKSAKIDGFVFAPLNKEAFKKGGWHIEDEHYLFAEQLGCLDRPRGLLNVLDDLWVFRVTGHVPFRDIVKYITPENVGRSVQLCYDTLRMAGYDNPRIAVAALNPHAGDGGTCGTEEIDVLIPVIEEYRAKGMDIYGPIPGDTLFIHAFNHEYDAVVTLFHDQGQIATKLHSFDVGVTVAGGLPYAITTPEHGTAFDIAGKGIAKTLATERAIAVAANMALTNKTK
ncbi:4-hydroxythreonine-4-phosphate dehydrogenase PdxA [Citrobacter portucalensis]|uniref:PdxA family dehydrogenase n=1 Tax=Citrobacter portucalensis TaxID=1639133 RepID=UPI0015E9A78D|nr:4-hydroxythreonine-4-phosphate dehydrogenase PdxA [Citrobacter portucalensis]MBA8416832.1 4-hydroxythreonine-4-phosphate dehydrogenase PdxA [Citrobacter freundii]MDE9613482.1 4-hydroxythreonine-4-phosphate dehydrogenase PdxA [Citrobacter portucalensis]QMM93618.1 4-hydroxythreonine-4-phosphate dehydrogenase PdxA [Citrobacter freundii]WFZ25376.1 4-hydroxythreonine-4-phosphate dehydrogenase PdxA [Citrobacter portucalensis]